MMLQWAALERRRVPTCSPRDDLEDFLDAAKPNPWRSACDDFGEDDGKGEDVAGLKEDGVTADWLALIEDFRSGIAESVRICEFEERSENTSNMAYQGEEPAVDETLKALTRRALLLTICVTPKSVMRANKTPCSSRSRRTF